MQSAGHTGVVESRVFVRSEDEEGISHMKVKPGSEVTKEDIIEINQKAGHFYKDVPEKSVKLLTDNCYVHSVNREARKYVFSKENEMIKVIKCNAVLVRSAVDRILINFLMTLYRPPFPIKVFSARDRAMEWLRQFK